MSDVETRAHTFDEGGYTLLEALVTLFIITEILIAVLMLFDFNSRVGTTQAQVAEVQQNARVAQNSMVRMVRMAGRGGLRQGPLPGAVGEPSPDVPGGQAISVQSNVAADWPVAPGWPDSPIVVPGTDVLTVRGSLTTRIGFLGYGPSSSEFPDGGPNIVLDSGETGIVFVPRLWQPIGMHDGSGGVVEQDLAPFIEAVESNRTEALLLTSRADPSFLSLVELDPARSNVSGDPLVIGFRFAGTPYSDALTLVSPFNTFSNAVSATILEEVRFYVRQPDGGLADTAQGRRAPSLTMARMLPFSNRPHGDDAANLALEIAENIWDLQVALGIDLDRDGSVLDGDSVSGVARAADEWLYNDAADVDTTALWNLPAAPLRAIRLTTLALTDRPDVHQYSAPAMSRLEDREYLETDLLNNDLMLRFRRRAVQTTVDLRGL